MFLFVQILQRFFAYEKGNGPLEMLDAPEHTKYEREGYDESGEDEGVEIFPHAKGPGYLKNPFWKERGYEYTAPNDT